MSEPIGMSIEIGGELPDDLIEEFLDTIKNEMGDIESGPLNRNDLRKESGSSIKWTGVTNYGMADDITAFCQKHNLSYVHHSDAKYEYDATIYYWLPGMDKPIFVQSNSEGDTLVDAAKIRPLVDLLLGLARDGKSALPLFVGVESLESLVEKGLKSYPKMLVAIRKEIEKMLPVAPTLPPLVIKE